LFTAAILAMAFAMLVVAYYWFSLNSFKKDLVFATRELTTNQLIYEGGQILFKRDSQDRTVSAFLRDENLSAVFFDINLKPFATYGIYQQLANDKKLEGQIDSRGLRNILDKDQPKFTGVLLGPDEEYFALTTPILFQEKTVGLLQVALAAPLFSRIKGVGIYLLIAVASISLLISWPLSRILVNFLLQPLEKVVVAMEQAQLANLNVPLEYKGNEKDEISTLVKAYNKMLGRIADGFERQKAFISNASHELKTPLSRTVSSLDLAMFDLKDQKHEDATRQIKVVRDDMFKFSRMIEELLLLSRIDAGVIKPKVVNVEVIKIFGELGKLYETEIRAKQLDVVYEIKAGLTVKADPVYLKLILSNLLSNSIKYSFKNGRIVIGSRINEDRAGIVIRDFGVGINATDRQHVFERFFRSAKIISTTTGFGVGMALAKQLSDLMGWEIRLREKIDQGTEVELGELVLVE